MKKKPSVLLDIQKLEDHLHKTDFNLLKEESNIKLPLEFENEREKLDLTDDNSLNIVNSSFKQKNNISTQGDTERSGKSKDTNEGKNFDLQKNKLTFGEGGKHPLVFSKKIIKTKENKERPNNKIKTNNINSKNRNLINQKNQKKEMIYHLIKEKILNFQQLNLQKNLIYLILLIWILMKMRIFSWQ